MPMLPGVSRSRHHLGAGHASSYIVHATSDRAPQSRRPGLFAIVEEAARDADDLTTTFDATYGFPAVISIDWERGLADDEVAYRTETFTITPWRAT